MPEIHLYQAVEHARFGFRWHKQRGAGGDVSRGWGIARVETSLTAGDALAGQGDGFGGQFLDRPQIASQKAVSEFVG